MRVVKTLAAEKARVMPERRAYNELILLNKIKPLAVIVLIISSLSISLTIFSSKEYWLVGSYICFSI